MGRPSKCVPRIRSQICKGLEAGASLAASCRAAGVSDSIVYEWLALAREFQRQQALPESERTPVPGYKKEYSDFLDEVTRAQGRRSVFLASTITMAATQDWRAAAWMLERLDPETYAPVVKAEAKVDLSVSEMLVDLVKDIRSRALEAQAPIDVEVVDVE